MQQLKTIRKLRIALLSPSLSRQSQVCCLVLFYDDIDSTFPQDLALRPQKPLHQLSVQQNRVASFSIANSMPAANIAQSK